MSLRLPRSMRPRRAGGLLGVLAALALGLVAGALQPVPVASPTVPPDAVRAPGAVHARAPRAAGRPQRQARP